MRSTLSLVPAALLSISLIGCTDDKNTNTGTPANPDARSDQQTPPPVNQERATTGGQPVPAQGTYDADGRDNTQQTHADRTTGLDRGTATGKRQTDASRTGDTTRDRNTVDRDSTTGTRMTSEPRHADNTGTNERDQNEARLTPMDQGSSDRDVEITQAIRKAVVDVDNMSVNAQNVKIITKNGVVTLRGPVANANERTHIANLAERTAGVTRVDNQLEVAAQ